MTIQTTDPPVRNLVVIGLLILLAGASGFVVLLILPDYLRSGSTSIVVLLVAGFVSVTLLLYLGTLVHRAAGLTSDKEALGMPEGSIRALIAMSLILMFAIIGVTVLYSGIGGEAVQSNGITAAELERLENVQIISISAVDPAASPGTERFNVTARPELSQAGHDFGLQLLTTVSTLVVAVAGFYFGSRAVSQGAKTAAAAQRAAATASAAGFAAGSVIGGTVATGIDGQTTPDDEANVAPLEESELVGAVEDVSAEDEDAADGADEVLVDADGEPLAEGETADDDGPKDGDKPPVN